MVQSSVERERLIQDLLHAARVLRDSGCLPATDGNLSARLAHDRALVTIRGIEKRNLTEWDFVEVPVAEASPADTSTEWGLHRALYLNRAEVECILHVHSPALTSFAAAHTVPAVELLAEAFMTIGEIALVPFAKPGTPRLADLLLAANPKAMVYLLSNHGAVAVGSSVRETLHRLERAEFLARVQIDASALGGPKPLTADQLADLATH
jgi:L-fuculose-phosphate aldolase